MPSLNRIRRVIMTGGRMDRDAAAYVAAVKEAGATVTKSQELEISKFITLEKSAGRWLEFRRIYLPVWSVAAANSICLRTILPGSYVGSVTHGAGFVQGDGSTGYFNFGASPNALGLTNSNCSATVLTLSPAPATGSNRSIIGVRDASPTDFRIFMPSGGGLSLIIMSAGDQLVVSTNRLGIHIISRLPASRFVGRRNSTGWQTLGSDTSAPVGSVPVGNIFGLGFNFEGSPSGFIESRVGAMAVGSSMTVEEATQHTLNVKNLWENVTGLVLP